MNAADVIASAERNALVRQWARRVLWVIAALMLAWMIDCHARQSQSSIDAITQSVHETTSAQVVRAAAIDTATARHETVSHDSVNTRRVIAAAHVADVAAQRADTAARTVTPTTVLAHDTIAVVPVEVTQRFAADSIDMARKDSIIEQQGIQIAHRSQAEAADHTVMRADSVVIRDLQHTIDLQSRQHAPRCGAKCGGAIGAAGLASLLYLTVHLLH